MTKKHFIALADIVRELGESYRGDDTVRVDFAMANVKMFLASFCAQQNPNFNRALWLDYIAGKCGPSGGKIRPGAALKIVRARWARPTEDNTND